MKENQIVFDSVAIDVSEQTFTILDGSIGTYLLEDIEKISVLGEYAKSRGKTPAFTHTVISGIGVVSAPLFEPTFYVGLKIVLKNKEVLAIYVSKKPVRMNTDLYLKDKKEAEIIQKALLKKGNIKLSKKEKDLQQVKEKSDTFNTLHKDMKSYWKGKSVFLIVALIGGILISLYNIDLKAIFPNLGGKPLISDEIEMAVNKLDELASFDVIDHVRNVTIHIENGKDKNMYTASVCADVCTYFKYDKDGIYTSTSHTNYEKKDVILNLNEHEYEYEFVNEDALYGKLQYKYDIMEETNIYVKKILDTYNTPTHEYAWNRIDEHNLKYYDEKMDKEKVDNEIIYTKEDIHYTYEGIDATYDVLYIVDKEGYMTRAKVVLEEENLVVYDYEFKNFNKK